MGRTVTLVLLDPTGAPLGVLPPFEVAVPWWQEVADVVAAVRARDGVDVQVLRLLDVAGDAWQGGDAAVSYLAQVSGPAPTGLMPADVDLSPHPLRAPYARPGGPAASVGWALAALDALGSPGAVAVQQRTWNLSAIWRLDVGGAPVAWLKQVPAFFGHEAAVLSLVAGVAPTLVPPLLAVGDEGRMLLAHVPGEDGHDAGAAVRARIAEQFHAVQAGFVGRTADLLATGMPDARLDARSLTAVAEPYRDRIDGLGTLIDDLPRRLEAVAACGLPDTLVHGDLHPGNVRVDGDRLVVMDWGDSTLGHPAHDILRLTGGLPAGPASDLLGAWSLRWRTDVPGSDPQRVAELMRPVTELRMAAVYAGFLAGIEPSEHPYHAGDVPRCLAGAVAAARPRPRDSAIPAPVLP